MMTRNMYDILDYGAVSDGDEPYHEAIQNAIDACYAAGGGTVLIPPGTYSAGTIWLKSNVNLHLQSGATLLGSTERSDYNADDAFPENRGSTGEHYTGAHLLVARRETNISITGNGTINGNGLHFFRENDEGKLDYGSWRPSQMLFFCECQNVRVKDINLHNSPQWALFLLGCEDAVIDSLTIISDSPPRHETDGIDIDCSRNVRISNCTIDTGDDCVTLRADAERLCCTSGEKPCENVCVTNCTLRSGANAVRIGVGSGIIRNAVFNNLVIHDSHWGLAFSGNYAAWHSGVDISNILFSNVVLEAESPFAIAGGLNGTGIRRIRFVDILARGEAASYISGDGNAPLEDIVFKNVDYVIRGGSGNIPDAPTPLEKWRKNGRLFWHGAEGLPCGMLLENAQQVWFRDFRMRWEQTEGFWRNGLDMRHCREIDCTDLNIEEPDIPGFESALARRNAPAIDD